MRSSLIFLSTLLPITSAIATEHDIMDMQTRSLLVRVESVERTADNLEILKYSIKNTTSEEVRVLLQSEGTIVGLCDEYQESTVPFMSYKEFPNTNGRGLTLKAGEQRAQSLVLSKECLRQRDLVHFIGFFFVRRPSGLIGSEGFALGNVYFKKD
jgi:hypothetical protein